MGTPKLRYYLDGRVHSDWVDVEVGEAVVVARLQKVADGTIQWVDQSGLLLAQTNCITHAQENGQNRQESSEEDGRVQGRHVKNRQNAKGSKAHQ